MSFENPFQLDEYVAFRIHLVRELLELGQKLHSRQRVHMSCRRGWARLGEQFRPRVRAQLRTFFKLGKSAKKTLLQAHLHNHEHQLGMKKMQMSSVLGENQEDRAHHHQELECRRSAS